MKQPVGDEYGEMLAEMAEDPGFLVVRPYTEEEIQEMEDRLVGDER